MQCHESARVYCAANEDTLNAKVYGSTHTSASVHDLSIVLRRAQAAIVRDSALSLHNSSDLRHARFNGT